MKKNILLSINYVLLAYCLAPCGVYAVDVLIDPATVTPSPGAVFTLSVGIDAGQTIIRAYDLYVEWNPAVMSVSSMVGAGSSREFGVPATVKLDEKIGSLHLTDSHQSGFSPTGRYTVATLTCTAKNGGSTAVGLRVIGLTTSNNSSPRISVLPGTVTVANAPPLPPSGLNVVDNPNDQGGALRVTWIKSGDDGAGANDIVYYRVLRAISSNGNFVAVGTCDPGTEIYLDRPGQSNIPPENGRDYWYKVLAYDGFSSSETSIFGPVQALDNIPPAPPTHVSAVDTDSDTGSSITVTWTLSADDSTGASDVVEYVIYRRASGGALDERVGSVPEGQTIFFDNGSQNAPAPVDGIEYIYAVEARDSNASQAIKSAYSPPAASAVNDVEFHHVSGWRDQASPSLRISHAMAYDAQRGKVVMFGGTNFSGQFGDTWEWDGLSWTLVASNGPSGRYGHAMVYDSARGKIVLFGGYGNSVISNETWEWDGLSWTLVSTTGPSALYRHAMAYDSARGKVVLFGGDRNGVNSNETWEWDGLSWTLVSTSGPSARYGHAMVYDSVASKVVLFGGNTSGGGESGETWTWNGTSWILHPASGPSPRRFHAMVYDSIRGKVVLFGGYRSSSNVRFDDTWEWNGSSWNQVSTSGPPARAEHVMAYDSARGKAVLFGGSLTNRIVSETWEWDGSNWTQHTWDGDGPSARVGHAMVFDSLRRKIVLFGGLANNEYLGDTWTWNGLRWIQVSTSGPSGRYVHAMAYDSARDKVVLFGGSSGGVYSGETWEWNGSSWTLVSTSGPSMRSGHAMVYDAVRGKVVLFGGSNTNNTKLFDTWEWNGTSWTLISSSGPSARVLHSMVFDSTRGKIVLFGGQTSSDYSNETWEWNGSSWIRVGSSGPNGRYGHAMAYDSALGKVLMFGGYTYQGPSSETWEWNGTSWDLVSTDGPAARYGHAMAYDSTRGKVVMNGGFETGPYYEETWEWTSTSKLGLASSTHPDPNLWYNANDARFVWQNTTPATAGIIWKYATIPIAILDNTTPDIQLVVTTQPKTVHLSGLAHGKHYFLARPLNSNGDPVDETVVFSFNVNAQLPSIASDTHPSQDAYTFKYAPLRVQLSTIDNESFTYLYRLDRKPNGDAVTLSNATALEGRNLEMNNLDPGIYFLHVTSVDTKGNILPQYASRRFNIGNPFDVDGDGIPNGTITNPGFQQDTDSDNDGLLDSQEDLNHNYVFNNGETEAFNPDTDFDGVIDAQDDFPNDPTRSSNDPTPTPTATVTSTATSTRTFTPTTVPTLTPTFTPRPTSTSTITVPPTSTPTVTPTSTATPTITATVTATDTPTITPTSTDTPTLTATLTPTETASFTPTNSPTVTTVPSPTITPTLYPTPLLVIEFNADDLDSGRILVGNVQGFAPAAVSTGAVPLSSESDGYGLRIHANPGEGAILYWSLPVPIGENLALLEVLSETNEVGAQLALAGLNSNPDQLAIDGQFAYTNPIGSAVPVNSNRWLNLLYQPPSGGLVPFLQAVVPSDAPSPVMIYFDRLTVRLLDEIPEVMESFPLLPPGDFESGQQGIVQNVVNIANHGFVDFVKNGADSVSILSLNPEHLAANIGLFARNVFLPNTFMARARVNQLFGSGGTCMFILTNGVESLGLYTFNDVLGSTESTIQVGGEFQSAGPIQPLVVVQNAGPGVRNALAVDDIRLESLRLEIEPLFMKDGE